MTYFVLAVGLASWVACDPALKSAGIFLQFVANQSLGKEPWWGDARIVSRLLQITGREATSKLTPTAEQIAAGLLGPRDASALQGKVAVVTGASAGIGEETTRVLMMHGCHVVLAVRNVRKGEGVLARMEGGKGTVMELDTSNLDSVKAFAGRFVALGLPLNYLVLNAGIMAPDQEGRSLQGFEQQFATNHLGHFLLARLLEGPLLASGSAGDPSRLVVMSSAAGGLWLNMGAGPAPQRLADQVPPTRPYSPLMVYGLTKSLNAMMAMEQQRRWGPSAKAVAVAVHPGISATALLGGASLEGIFMGWLYWPFRKNVPQAASTTVWACLSPDVPRRSRLGRVYCHNNAEAQDYANPQTLEPGVAEEAWRLSDALIQGWL